MTKTDDRIERELSEVECHLRRVAERDLTKGGTGLRSTREICEATGLSITVTRSRLRFLASVGAVDECDGAGTGDPILWRFKAEVFGDMMP